jgi:hypothetical protein
MDVGILGGVHAYQEARPTSRPFVATGDDDNLTVEDIQTTRISLYIHGARATWRRPGYRHADRRTR